MGSHGIKVGNVKITVDIVELTLGFKVDSRGIKVGNVGPTVDNGGLRWDNG